MAKERTTNLMNGLRESRIRIPVGRRPESVAGAVSRAVLSVAERVVFGAVVFWSACAVCVRAADPSDGAYAAARERLVRDFIEAEGISDERVLGAIRRVPRHEFVPPRLRARAYHDEALAIGAGQTISPPYIVAWMTQVLDPQRGDRVLEIGTGSGYQAAVLAEIVSEVYTVEIVESLAASAERRLKRLGYDNVFVKAGDGYEGWPEHAPYDRIIVTCSPERVPEPLIAQLREGGAMIIPVGQRYQQAFYLLKKENGRLRRQRMMSTLFVPMTGRSEQQRRVQPDSVHPAIVNGGFEQDENSDGKPDGWHYVRRAVLMQDSPVEGERCLQFEADEDGQLAQALQGMALNGRLIGALEISFWMQAEKLFPGTHGERAGMIIHFYDGRRQEIAVRPVVLRRDDISWTSWRRTVPVPRRTREIVVRIGLNGAVGQMAFDDVRLRGIRR